MTRSKFALTTLGALGGYLILVLVLPAVFPDWNLVQVDGTVQMWRVVFNAWADFALVQLLNVLFYFSFGIFAPDFSISLFYIAFYALLLIWLWAEVQRLRHFRHSHWWVLVSLIPYVGVGLYLYLLFRPSPAGNKTENCPECGKPTRAGSAFCYNCGHEFSD
ncbi:MAG: hypothetical protein P8046_07980 [Anaerolineales bacterium]